MFNLFHHVVPDTSFKNGVTLIDMLHKDFMVIFEFYAFFNFQNANVLGMNYSGQLHPGWPLILCNKISLFASKICIFLTMLVKCLIECNASDSSGPNCRIA